MLEILLLVYDVSMVICLGMTFWDVWLAYKGYIQLPIGELVIGIFLSFMPILNSIAALYILMQLLEHFDKPLFKNRNLDK